MNFKETHPDAVKKECCSSGQKTSFVKDWADRHEYTELKEGCVVRSNTSGVIKKKKKL